MKRAKSIDPSRLGCLALAIALGALVCTGCRVQEPSSESETPASTEAAPTESARASLVGETQRSPNDDLVVGTWNLEWFYDEHSGDNFSDLAKQQSAPGREQWSWRRDAVANSIADAAPDILALQEIESQRVLYYLTSALDRNHQRAYRSGFVGGTDFHTEQDVGFLTSEGAVLTRIARHEPSRAAQQNSRFSPVSKHAEGLFDIPVGDGVERVTVMTLHLRARGEAIATRTRQARLVHAWLATRIAAGENVIVMGDANSESTNYPASPGTDMAALCGFDTPSTDDDLVDLGQYLPEHQRQTHLIRGKHFDRILVSPSLIEDAPDRIDLVFDSIERREDLAVRGRGVDPPAEHWERYWEMDTGERDLSDHWPLFARFTLR